jgi:hypothetical protein
MSEGGAGEFAAADSAPNNPIRVLGSMPRIQAKPAPIAVATVHSPAWMRSVRAASTRPCNRPTSTPSSKVPSVTASSAPSTIAAGPGRQPSSGPIKAWARSSVAPSPRPSASALASIQRG